MEMSRLTRDGTAESVLRDLILKHARGQKKNQFSCSADLVQDWQPYPVDPYSCYICDHTHTYCTIEEQVENEKAAFVQNSTFPKVKKFDLKN